jgi:hypothetical protein
MDVPAQVGDQILNTADAIERERQVLGLGLSLPEGPGLVPRPQRVGLVGKQQVSLVLRFEVDLLLALCGFREQF